MRVTRIGGALLPLVVACQPGTTRPSFTPLPEAEVVEVRLQRLEATKRLAEALEADSIPARRVELEDGYIESQWFDSASGRPSSARPIGTGIVKVRAWADPGRPGFTLLTAESVFRPLADPSLPPRELEREVPDEHPVAAKVHAALEDLVKKFGGPPVSEPAQPRNAANEENDTGSESEQPLDDQ